MLHHLCRLQRQSSPFLFILGSDLPPAIVFISDTPVFDLMRFLVAICDPLFRILSLVFQIAVLDPVTHFLSSTGSCIRTDIWLAADLPAHLNVLICSKGIRLLHTPCLVEQRHPFLSDTILPVIRRHKAAARPSQNRHVNLAHRTQHICTQSVLI